MRDITRLLARRLEKLATVKKRNGDVPSVALRKELLRNITARDTIRQELYPVITEDHPARGNAHLASDVVFMTWFDDMTTQQRTTLRDSVEHHKQAVGYIREFLAKKETSNG